VDKKYLQKVGLYDKTLSVMDYLKLNLNIDLLIRIKNEYWPTFQIISRQEISQYLWVIHGSVNNIKYEVITLVPRWKCLNFRHTVPIFLHQSQDWRQMYNRTTDWLMPNLIFFVCVCHYWRQKSKSARSSNWSGGFNRKWFCWWDNISKICSNEGFYVEFV